jgi:hypothetical protein
MNIQHFDAIRRGGTRDERAARGQLAFRQAQVHSAALLERDVDAGFFA